MFSLPISIVSIDSSYLQFCRGLCADINDVNSRHVVIEYFNGIYAYCGWLGTHTATNATVVFMGAQIAGAFGHTKPPLVWHPKNPWVMIPEPTDPFYDNPVQRTAVGILLADILRGAGCLGEAE